MLHAAFFIKLLLLLLHTNQGLEIINTTCGNNILLPCTGVDGNNFLSITWYKEINSTLKTGIIRNPRNGKPQEYGYKRKVWFGDQYGLVLPNVDPQDSGIYECAINANIGSRNLNLKTKLEVDECVTTLQTVTLTNSAEAVMLTESCQNKPMELPLLWTIIGYVSVCAIKLILCVISIWVIRIRCSKKRRQRW